MILSLATGLGVSACSGGQSTSDTTPCEGKCDGDGLEAIHGPDLVSCWVESGPAADSIQCKYTPPSARYPLQPGKITATALKTVASVGTKNFASADLATTPDAATEVISIARGEYPVLVSVMLDLTGPKELLGRELSFLTQSIEYRSAQGPALDIKLPFDIWPIDVIGGGDLFTGTLTTYELSVAPLETFFTKPTIPTMREFAPIVRGEKVSTFLAVNPEMRELTGEGSFCDPGCVNQPFVLDGPGTYVAEKGGLRRATAEDLSPFRPDAGSPSDGGGDNDGGISGDAGNSDAARVSDAQVADAAPVCGTNGQPRCAGQSSCAQWNMLEGNICRACGMDGQQRCYINSSYTCAPSHVSDGSTCHVCGKDGQLRCYINNQYVCDPGYVSDGNLCHVCGKDGQPRCYINNQYVCDPGYVSDGSLCHVCGKDGQQRCYINNNYTCDPGHVFDGSYCRACGALGQICCSNSRCSAGSCSSGMCR